MIKGIFFGVFVAVLVSSLALLYLSVSGNLVENVVTGAVIGTSGLASYAIITSIISIGVVFFLYLVMRSHKPRRE